MVEAAHFARQSRRAHWLRKTTRRAARGVPRRRRGGRGPELHGHGGGRDLWRAAGRGATLIPVKYICSGSVLAAVASCSAKMVCVAMFCAVRGGGAFYSPGVAVLYALGALLDDGVVFVAKELGRPLPQNPHGYRLRCASRDARHRGEPPRRRRRRLRAKRQNPGASMRVAVDGKRYTNSPMLMLWYRRRSEREVRADHAVAIGHDREPHAVDAAQSKVVRSVGDELHEEVADAAVDPGQPEGSARRRPQNGVARGACGSTSASFTAVPAADDARTAMADPSSTHQAPTSGPVQKAKVGP